MGNACELSKPNIHSLVTPSIPSNVLLSLTTVQLRLSLSLFLPVSLIHSLNSKSCYDRRSVGQSVLVSVTHIGPMTKTKQTPWPLVRKRTIPTDRPRILVANFVDRGVSRGQRGGSPTVVNLSFLDWSRYFSFR
jgi:hypothetical protein